MNTPAKAKKELDGRRGRGIGATLVPVPMEPAPLAAAWMAARMHRPQSAEYRTGIRPPCVLAPLAPRPPQGRRPHRNRDHGAVPGPPGAGRVETRGAAMEAKTEGITGETLERRLGE